MFMLNIAFSIITLTATPALASEPTLERLSSYRNALVAQLGQIAQLPVAHKQNLRLDPDDVENLRMRLSSVEFILFGEARGCPNQVFASVVSDIFPFTVYVCQHFAATYPYHQIAHVLLHEVTHLIRGHRPGNISHECEAEDLATKIGTALHQTLPGFPRPFSFYGSADKCKRSRNR